MIPNKELQCPFCNAREVIISFPINTPVLKYCSNCNRALLLLGRALFPLNEDVFPWGSKKEKQEVLMEKINQYFTKVFENILEVEEEYIKEENIKGTKKSKRKKRTRKRKVNKPSIINKEFSFITKEEVNDFRRIDLNLIDKKEFFDKYFGEIVDDK